jgi:RNA polymerase sigma-70 factor (ECF subfamily)
LKPAEFERGIGFSRFGERALANELTGLVDECLAGDQLALQKLVDRFRSQVFGLCFRMLGQKEDAEDATQETMLRVVRNLHRWDNQRAFEPWLLTIAGNRCRTRLARRSSRPPHFSLEHPVAEESDSRNAEMSWLKEEIRLAVAQLRPVYQQAFNLFHEQGMGYVKIAETMSIPLGTVKTWVHRARREVVEKLRKREILDRF